ncbi:AAA domain-containing protein [Amycolatopsis xylanica]|uniref:AAA domain-containing protein n=1 Tax=Amycolatopsis xylanica TaxID=589385 RepID=A0A1H3JYS1_9PSEU|nr:AAA domain-containing protein [Amycolatopsis xylanica]SDY45082.1 AAA domain-containing protein [Amycolatopsis xylanica]
MHRDVVLPGAIFLVPGRSLDDNIRRYARDYLGLPAGLGQIITDLNARRDGVPATITRSNQGLSFRLYTDAYTVLLNPSKNGDGYWVSTTIPLRLWDHERLSHGFLLIRTRWIAVSDIRQIPPGTSSRWPEMNRAWDELDIEHADRREVPALSPAHTRFLDTVDQVITVTNRVEENRNRSAPVYPYRAVEPAGERRYSAKSVYVFRVLGDRRPERAAFVQIRGESEQRGRVLRAGDDGVTVGFDESVAWDRLAQQGVLEESSTNIVTVKRREAVELLRTRRARNHRLLTSLVDQQVTRIRADARTPGEALDEDQLSAFRHALAVEDLLVVLGPPGTGKTRVISQIARACALDPAAGPVLVTSHTNRAVDNVLGKLPRDVVVVRVGNEGSVGAEGKPFLLEQFVAQVRGEAVSTANAALRSYEGLPTAHRWLGELGIRVGGLRIAIETESLAAAELQRVRLACGGSAAAAVTRLTGQIAASGQVLTRRQGKLSRLIERDARARGRRLFGPLTDALATARGKRIVKRQTEVNELTAAGERLRGALAEAESALDEVTGNLPPVQAARQAFQQAVGHRDQTKKAAFQAVRGIQAAVGRAGSFPAVVDGPDNGMVFGKLAELHAGLGPWLAMLERRAKLLGEWHKEVAGATEQLSTELVRYADVVGATCIGSATSKEIAEVPFDLVIVDEAGQIATPDVLVPLVRGRRAVLVGDHRQLPPVVDTELNAATKTGDPEVRDMLMISTLESLVGKLPRDHIVPLTRQRRMPREIADFISEAFYDGTLKTMVTRIHDSSLFRSPLAFVDTSQLPESRRRERAVPGGGTINQAEAHLLTRLAVHYQRRGEEWALIVPYKAQVKLIKELLVREIPDNEVVDANVGSVDAFQGGERDVILYGFTRSNALRKVGFLDELRRANVAFTRAKHQLVLVGDMDTLSKATDLNFRRLAESLRDHVLSHGDVCHYAAVLTRLEDEHA